MTVPGRGVPGRSAPGRSAPGRTLPETNTPETNTPGRTVIRARQALVDGVVRPAQVWLDAGLVARVGEVDEPVPSGVDVVDLPDAQVLLPGLVDSHVHVDEPGRTDWEGFATATRAAVAGGVTTIVDMPLNSIPPTVSVAALAAKRAAAAGQLSADVAYWGGAVPDSLGRLGALHDAGVRGFKAFLAPSGVDEFPSLDAAQLREALAEVAALGSVLLVHAEDPAHLRESASDGRLGPHHVDFVASRPAVAERAAVATVVEAVRATGGRAHVLHLCDGGSLSLLRAAKADGLPVTVETCPHYLTFDAELVPDGATEFKCCPPIRHRANRELLWAAVADGTIDAIVSDHSPAPAAAKLDGDFGRAWGGIAGLQLGLRAVWTEARQRGLGLAQIVPLLGTGPAAVAGLDGLGRIVPGGPAHLVAFDPEAMEVVDAARLEHRQPVSAFHGRTLAGAVRTVWLRGEVVVADGAVIRPERGVELVGGRDRG